MARKAHSLIGFTPAARARRVPNRAAFGFILVTVLLDALSFGLVYPVLPRLVLELSRGGAADSSRDFGLIAGTWALMNFLAAPLLGVLSDRFGRRPVILISLFGLSLDLAVMALASNVGWLFVGRMLSGVTAANYQTASAYLADVTAQEDRARRFGLLSAMYGVGLILGPAAGGLMAQVNLRAPFWMAALLTVFGWLYGLLVLPESLPPERRAKISWREAIPVKALGILTRYEGLAGLAGMLLLTLLAAQAVNALVVLYTAYRYGWTTANVGVLLMAYSLGSILMMGLIGPKCVQLFGERTTLLSGLAFIVVGFLGLALAPTSLWFSIGCAIAGIGNIATPPLQALLTEKVRAEEQGRLQGALSALLGIAGMVGPVVFTQIFAWSISGTFSAGRSGIALAISAVLAASAFLLALVVVKKVPAASRG